MDKDKSKKLLKILLNTIIILLILLGTSIAIYFIYKNKGADSEENILTYTELVNEIKAGTVEKNEYCLCRYKTIKKGSHHFMKRCS